MLTINGSIKGDTGELIRIFLHTFFKIFFNKDKKEKVTFSTFWLLDIWLGY